MGDFFSEVLYTIKNGEGAGKIFILMMFIGMFLFPILGIVMLILFATPTMYHGNMMILIGGIIGILAGIGMFALLFHQYKNT